MIAGAVRQGVTLAAWITALLALAYLVEPAYFDPLFRDKYLANLPLLLLHGFSGIVALAVGPVLIFEDPLGRGWPRMLSNWHRRLGRLYVTAVVLGALSGYRLANIAHGGALAQTGFAVLALLWLATVTRAYLAIRAHEIGAHRAWIARNYALTFSAVSLRGILHAAEVAGLSFDGTYPWAAWLCWVPNLLLLELWLRRRVR